MGDLFFNNSIIEEAENAISDFVEKNKFPGIIILGAPVKVENSIFNCAIIIQKNTILGIVPKTFLPNSGEFREKRWFKTDYDFDSVIYASFEVPFGSIKFIDELNKVNFGVEICYDMFAPISMSSIYAINGCNMIFNIAASDEVRTPQQIIFGVDEETNVLLRGVEKLIQNASSEDQIKIILVPNAFDKLVEKNETKKEEEAQLVRGKVEEWLYKEAKIEQVVSDNNPQDDQQNNNQNNGQDTPNENNPENNG